MLSVLNWKRNIRGRLFWSAFISFFLSFFVTVPLDMIVIKMPWAFGKLFLMVFIFIFFFFLFTRPIVRYMRTLADGLIAIAQGNLNKRVPVHPDELGEVANNINFMAEQLQELIQREKQAERSKMELITNVSHDLRTPLTSIAGYLNLLKNDNYQDLEEHKRYIQNAFNKTEQLTKLVDDLFEYTRLSGGAVQLERKPVNVSNLLEQMLTEIEPIIRDNGLQLHTERDSKDMTANVDAEQLARAIDNLLMNAIKFSTKPGVISVTLKKRAGRIRLNVVNKGEPIAKEKENLLFERFYKAEESRREQNMPNMSPGAGLGLSIARNIVELHGGYLGLEHDNGLFTFYMELPVV